MLKKTFLDRSMVYVWLVTAILLIALSTVSIKSIL